WRSYQKTESHPIRSWKVPHPSSGPNEDRRPRLAGGAEELRQLALRSAGHGEVIEGSYNISPQLSRTSHKFACREAGRRNGNALEMDRHGALPLRADVLDILQRLLQRHCRIVGGCLDVCDVALEHH